MKKYRFVYKKSVFYPCKSVAKANLKNLWEEERNGEEIQRVTFRKGAGRDYRGAASHTYRVLRNVHKKQGVPETTRP